MQDDNQNTPQPNQTITPGGENQPADPVPAASKPKRWPPQFWTNFSRRRKIVVGFLAFIILCLIVAGVMAATGSKTTTPTSSPKKASQKASTTVASPLTGVQVAPDLAKRQVTAVMIENSQDARPQSGLTDAGIVYEAIAEGGITRFMALFQESTPQYVGPVRSIRPYYLDLGAPYGASFAHVGGSPEALNDVRNSLRDLDQFLNSDSYWRVTSRAAPHNVYTSFAKLDTLNSKKGYTLESFKGFARKSGKPVATPTEKTIDLHISSDNFFVHYDYDVATNTYLRSEGGVAHMSTSSEADKTGVRIAPKVVVALTMNYSIQADDIHSFYNDTGTGEAFIFQDGEMTKATWSKGDRNSPLSLTDAAGAPIKLEAGQTWVTLVQPDQVRVGG